MDKTKESKEMNVVLNQCRLRGITSICIKKLTIALPTISNDADDRSIAAFLPPLLHFTLHSSKGLTSKSNQKFKLDQQEVYSSESIPHSENPTWSTFKITNPNVGNATDFDVRLYISHGNSYLPALQWNISVSQLVCIGETSLNDQLNFDSNAVVIGINNLYYVPHNCLNQSTSPPPISTLLPSYDFNNPRSSYSSFSLSRILALVQTRDRSIKTTEHLSTTICEMLKNQPTANLQMKGEKLRSEIERRRELFEREKMKLQTLMRKRDSKRQLVEKLESELRSEEEGRLASLRRYESSRTRNAHMRDNLMTVRAHKQQRERDLLAELNHIFPITSQPLPSTASSSSSNHKNSEKKSGGGGDGLEYRVCGAKLANSEHFSQKEDSTTSTALGHVAQLLIMVSRFTGEPLRYPIHFNGSLSSIYDHATADIVDKNRIFPLYFKGSKERLIVKYGVFLLNKSIAQLRFHYGMPTHDLRPTLHNLDQLLRARIAQLSKPTIFIPSDPIMIAGSGNHHHKIQAVDVNRDKELNNGQDEKRREKDISSSLASTLKLSSNESLKSLSSGGGGGGVRRNSDLKSKRQELFSTSQRKHYEKHQQDRRATFEYSSNMSSNDNLAEFCGSSRHSSDPLKNEKSGTKDSGKLLTGLESSGPGTRVGMSRQQRKFAYEDARAELLATREHNNNNHYSGSNNSSNQVSPVVPRRSSSKNDDDDDLC